MGRACSKVAPQEISSPSSLQYVNTTTAAGTAIPVTPQVLQDLIARLAPETGPLKFLTNRLQLKIQEIQVGKAYAEIRPPHEQVFDDPPQLTNTFNFYVSIYELRIRGLLQTPAALAAVESGSLVPLVQQLSAASHVSRGTGRRALSGASNLTSGASPSASSADYVALVSWDNNSEFIRTTFERLDDHGTLRFPGHWNFLWRFEGQRLAEMRDRFLLIALFRLEHLRNASLVGYTTIDILSITVGPIHHDFAFHRWGGGSGGPNKARVQFECRTTQICNLSCIPVEVRVSIEGGHVHTPDSTLEPSSCGTPPPAAQQSAHQQLGNSSTPSSPDTPQTASQTLNPPPDQYLSSQVTAGLDLIPPKAKSVSNLGARQMKVSGSGSSSSTANVPTVAVVAAALNPVSHPTSGGGGEGSGSSAKGVQKKVSVIAEVDELDGPTTKHQGDDEKCLVKAEWKVDFAVSGIANAVPSASTWTSVTTEPYWLAIDSTAHPPQDRELYILPVGNDTGGSNGPHGSGRLSKSQAASGVSVSNPGSGRASFRQKPAAGSRTTMASSYAYQTGDSTHSSPMSYKLQPSRFHQDSILSSASNPQQLLQRHLENDYQARYRELAAACQDASVISFAKSALAKNSCLQPFYLRTTSEGIRQYYLTVRLWHKPLGVGSAKLYAEALIPFFKLFDADIVSCRSFFDARFRETLWSDGRNVGKISAVLVFQDIPVLRQMFAGVSTENGYHRLISPTMFQSNPQLHVIPEIALLTKLTRELENHWLRTNVMHAEKVRKSSDAAAAPDPTPSSPLNISDINDKLIDLLSKSSLAGTSPHNAEEGLTPIFPYPSVNCLMEGQRILLELGNHILVSQDHLPWSLRGALGNILILILKRGELDMGNVLPQVPHQFLDRRKEMYNLYNMTKSNPPKSSQDDLLASPQQQKVTTTTSTIDPVSTAGASGLSATDIKDLADYNSRMAVTLSYGKFLMKLLVCANEKIQSEAMFESQRKQIASYYAFLYNRIPALRTKILQTVLTDEERDVYVTEWRGIEFGLDKLSLIQRDDWSVRPWPGLYELQLILDWNPFYQSLKDYYGSSAPSHASANECQSSGSCCCCWLDPKDRIEQIFNDQPNALNWLRPRSFTFYLFLNSLIRLTWSQLDYNQQKKLAAASSPENVEDQQASSRTGGGLSLRHNLAPTRIFFQRATASSGLNSKSEHDSSYSVSGAKGSVTRAALGNLRWDLIPGYASLLKAFLLALREKPVNKFSDALLNCSATLLVNDRLLVVFMRIVLTRTSVFSRDQVFSAFNYLDFWFEIFSLKSQSLPLTMDYRLLSKAIEAVISSDLALQTAKTLWFLYKRMDLFINQKLMLKIIADLILYRHSQKLLLHWSWLVRKCFTHLLLYRVCENARKLVAKSSAGEPPQLGIEERLILWSYLLISEIIKALGIASVFPEKFSTVSVRRLLGQPLPPNQQHASTTLIWNLPAVLNTVAPNTPTKVPTTAPISGTTPADTPIIEDSNLKKSINSPNKDPGRSWMIRRPTAFKFRKRKSVKDELDDDEVLQDPTGEDDVFVFEYEAPELYLPAIAELTPQMKPYVQHIVSEFAKEVELYKVWVISGQPEVPPMHIPASPLDTNVDVPLEVD